jgi:PD-(D/E)XK nuclease superfamily
MLSVRPPVAILPSYSLTGDLVGFLRCGLQYRYTRLSHLPPSHPVQLWFGQFIHAVLEEAYRTVKEKRKSMPPWPQKFLDDIYDRIDRRLAANNIFCWDEDSEILGRRRATAAVNELGPILFPLINQAEVRVRGARPLPLSAGGMAIREVDRYEIQGVIDVVTQVELFAPKLRGNKLLELIVEELPDSPPDEFEVIVDYKGMSRPAPSESSGASSLWAIYGWQVQTYAHLRSLLTTKPIIAGVLIYLNELAPTKSDFIELRKALRKGDPEEILPEACSDDAEVLLTWKPSAKVDEPPLLSLDYRLNRAVRVVPVTPKSISESLDAFDRVVGRIEKCLADEAKTGKVIRAWEKNSDHEPTCEACDARTYCPSFTKQTRPRLPGYKA